MKIVFFILATCSIACAQLVLLNSSYENLLLLTPDGHLGIGITDPQAKLDVYGPVRLRSNSGDNKTMICDGNGFASWSLPGGDINQTLADSRVIGIQGRTISATAPIDGQVLKWRSAQAQWLPEEDISGGAVSGDITAVTVGIGLSGGGASGDVQIAGLPDQPLWHANKLLGIPVLPSTLSADNMLLALKDRETQAISYTTDITPNTPVWNANKLASQRLWSFTPEEGNLLSMSHYWANSWIPQWTPDEARFYANRIKSTPVSSVLPTVNKQILMWNGSAWEGRYTPDSSVWNGSKMLGYRVSTQQPQDRQILTFSTTENGWQPGFRPEDAVYNAKWINGRLFWSSTALEGHHLMFSVYHASRFIAAAGANEILWNGNRLQGQPVSTTLPTKSQQFLVWSGSEWQPGGTPGDPVWNVNKFRGTAVSGAAPADSQMMTCRLMDAINNIYEWQPGEKPNNPIWNGKNIQGRAVESGTPGDWEMMTWNTSYGQWKHENIHTTVLWRANRIRNLPISTTAPLNGQALKWNGTEWGPADDLVLQTAMAERQAIIAAQGAEIENLLSKIDANRRIQSELLTQVKQAWQVVQKNVIKEK